VAADSAETLYDDPGSIELHIAELLRDLGRDGQAEPSCADFIERYATELPRQANCAANLVLEPGHGYFVRTHIGSGDVLLQIAYSGGKGTDESLFLGAWQRRIAEDHRLCTSVRQPRRGILEGHGASQAEAFFCAHIWRHTRATDRRPDRGIVDHDNGLEPEARLVDVDNLFRTQVVSVSESLLHAVLR
jgi:hypothetical protein